VTLSEIDASSLKIAKFPSGASISSLLSERMDNVALLAFCRIWKATWKNSLLFSRKENEFSMASQDLKNWVNCEISHIVSQLASSLASFYLVIQIIICLHIPVLFYCYWQIDNIQFFGGKDKQCFIGCLLLNDQIEDKLIYPYLLIRSLVFEPTGSVKKLPL